MSRIILQHGSEEVIMETSIFISTFFKHESCPKCGSRDNLGRWSDGHAYCFGCYYYEPPTLFTQQTTITQQQDVVKSHIFPDDFSTTIGTRGWTWLKKYGILSSEVTNFLWSESKQWLIMPFYDSSGCLLAWQARNFSLERPKPRYLSFGQISDIMHFEGNENVNMVIIVEDMLSAIKVGRSQIAQAMPCFGSNIPLKTLTRLKAQFKYLGIWLDMDMAGKALQTHCRASQLGFKQVFMIKTPYDPKTYTDEDIKTYVIQGANLKWTK